MISRNPVLCVMQIKTARKNCDFLLHHARCMDKGPLHMRPVTGPVWLLEEFFGLSIWEISAPLAGMKSEKHNQNGTGT